VTQSSRPTTPMTIQSFFPRASMPRYRPNVRVCAERRTTGCQTVDPEFSTKQPLFAVSDWTREAVLLCKTDGRRRVPLVTAQTCQTAAIKVQMVIYPVGTKSATSYHHEGAESFIYLLSGRGRAGTRDRSCSVRKGGLIWFRDGEWHRLERTAGCAFSFSMHWRVPHGLGRPEQSERLKSDRSRY
jgi:mannose-6-phosphate isomerase-like protein (cupin superfamily)